MSVQTLAIIATIHVPILEFGTENDTLVTTNMAVLEFGIKNDTLTTTSVLIYVYFALED